ncbi:hypothetical protein [Streptomyces sp. NPDC048581]|uniref:hypothetical protein n=1 Tax=unclassified Streptomyces TaxID=2593676 RepID=UPI00371A7C6F
MHNGEPTTYDYALAVVRRGTSQIRFTAIVILSGFGWDAYADPIWSWTPSVVLYTWLVLGVVTFRARQPTAYERRWASELVKKWENEAKLAERKGVGTPLAERTKGRLAQRLRDWEVYLLCTFLGLSLFGLRDVLTSLDSPVGLGPADTPAIVSTAIGIPALITAAILVIPHIVRAWGAQARDERAGDADVIRAEKEGQAAIIRAQAELRRADAEFLRAEKGLEPLPAPPPPDNLPAVPAPGANGDGLTQTSPAP